MTVKNRVIIENIRLPYTAANEDAFAAAAKMLRRAGISPSDASIYLHKKSLDARRAEPTFVYSLFAEIDAPYTESLAALGIRSAPYAPLTFERGCEPIAHRPVIAGFGPAGMFCALILAEAGMRPIIIEKGANVTERTRIVEAFMNGGAFDKNTNIQFGAGGAGTFSDGKLTTRVNDPRCAYITEKLIELGAPEAIRYQAKPHIGTDVLRRIVERADEKLRSLGAEIKYNTSLTDISENSVNTTGGELPYGALVLATGHSAHDIYSLLLGKSYCIEAKPFSVGVRIEHLQKDIDRALYGKLAGSPSLPQGEYCLSHTKGKRGVYTFCMCPGGVVVPASADEGGIISNGMSYSSRNGKNANSAIAVTVNPTDYGNTPQKAIGFQRDIEAAAFRVGGGDYSAPIQTVGGFFDGKVTDISGRIAPTYRRGSVTPADLNLILPSFVTDALKDGISVFGKRMKGFDAADVPLTGVETRTSAPVRIVRSEALTASASDRVYPCGEGAGYAGGIMSAALDGLRVAAAILKRYSD